MIAINYFYALLYFVFTTTKTVELILTLIKSFFSSFKTLYALNFKLVFFFFVNLKFAKFNYK